MKNSFYKSKVESLLYEAGVAVNPERDPKPGDIRVYDERFYKRVALGGSLALGETYQKDWWFTKMLDVFFFKLLRSGFKEKSSTLRRFVSTIFNMQSRDRSARDVHHHYGKGNDWFMSFLDLEMVYSCAYWQDADNLAEAQSDKMRLIAEKLHLKPGQRLLDIGCGWGGFDRFAAKNYGVSVVGITLEPNQVAYATEYSRDLPIEIRLQDYRDIKGEKFDHIVSVGMFEHVGPKNYRTYFKTVADLLEDDGLFLLHTIGSNISDNRSDPWFEKYIFPNGVLPSIAQIGEAIEGLYVMEDWHNFGADYDKTLIAWRNNFIRNWHSLHYSYSDWDYNTQIYYLSSLAGAFRARRTQLWQIVLSKKGVLGGYKSVR
jgi:cyclopropane-fatty-acyl-phospholipid synthase